MIYHLCLGSNLNNPEMQLDKAISAIAALPNLIILRQSSRIRSTPYGRVQQPDFYNQVLETESSDSPQLLLSQLLAIETEMGRIRKEKWGPRIIDIDILLAEHTVIDTRNNMTDNFLPEVTLPHSDFHNRVFALQLLNELIPKYEHPIMHKSINELYYILRNPGGKP